MSVMSCDVQGPRLSPDHELLLSRTREPLSNCLDLQMKKLLNTEMPAKKLRCSEAQGTPLPPAVPPSGSMTDEDQLNEASDSDGSDGFSDALSEQLEHLQWSDDEEDVQGQPEKLESLSVVVSSQAETETHHTFELFDALKSLSSPPLDLDFCVSGPFDPLQVGQCATPLAYGRKRRRAEATPLNLSLVAAPPSIYEALPAHSLLRAPAKLCLPPPAPLSEIPPLLSLLEAGRNSLMPGEAQKSSETARQWLYPPHAYPFHVWDEETEPSPSSSSRGPPRQGDRGFKAYARRALDRMRTMGIEHDLASSLAPLQEYQLRVAFLLHPMSPISRLMVVHATGSGKTRTVLAAADAFYHSGKATCLFFPEEAVKENFYQELLKFPGTWRDFFCASEDVPNWRARRHHCWTPEEVARFPPSQVEACLGLERRVKLGEITSAFYQDWSRRNQDVPPPSAPLRAFKYTTAGGSKGGWRRNGAFDPGRMDSVFRFGFDGKNPMSNKNLVFDEVHNMLALPKWRGNYWKEPLRRLRRAVTDCKGSTVVFLTGSPVQTDVADGARLLRVLKGSEHVQRGNEGWLDIYLERPLTHYPEVLPCGVPDRPLCEALQAELVKSLELPEEMESKYLEVAQQGADVTRLRDYCNMAVHHTWALRPQKKLLLLEAAEDYCAKLNAVAEAILSSGQKALAAVSRRGGLQVLKELLKQRAPDETQIAVFSGRKSALISRGVEGEKPCPPTEVLRMFNDPSNSQVRVLLLDTAFGREGLSALGVGQLHLVDVPSSWAEYKQIVGRAVRFGDVQPGKQRQLRVHLWVSRLADGSGSADEDLLEVLEQQGEALCTAERQLNDFAI